MVQGQVLWGRGAQELYTVEQFGKESGSGCAESLE